jgi:hypothetical protein
MGRKVKPEQVEETDHENDISRVGMINDPLA